MSSGYIFWKWHLPYGRRKMKARNRRIVYNANVPFQWENMHVRVLFKATANLFADHFFIEKQRWWSRVNWRERQYSWRPWWGATEAVSRWPLTVNAQTNRWKGKTPIFFFRDGAIAAITLLRGSGYIWPRRWEGYRYFAHVDLTGKTRKYSGWVIYTISICEYKKYDSFPKNEKERLVALVTPFQFQPCSCCLKKKITHDSSPAAKPFPYSPCHFQTKRDFTPTLMTNARPADSLLPYNRFCGSP